MKRHCPPVCGSSLSTIVSYLRGPHHWVRLIASVIARNPRAAGACSSYVIVMSCLPGSAFKTKLGIPHTPSLLERRGQLVQAGLPAFLHAALPHRLVLCL